MFTSITRRRRRLAAAVVVTTLAVPAAAWAANPFTDVADGRFYTEAVDWAYNNGITTGTSATTFSPDDTVTRGQNITFTHRYDQEIVQPALEDLSDEIDAAQADVDAAQADVEALMAAISSDFSVSHHSSALVDDGVGTPLAIGRFVSQIQASGDGWLQLPLTVPATIAGVEFMLESIEYCHVGGTGTVNTFGVWSGGTNIAIENADRSSGSCYTLEVGTTEDNLMASFNLQDDGMVSITDIKTNWTAA